MTTTPTNDTIPATVEEGYDAVKNLIFDQVHKFRRKYGGDVDELVGEANIAFVRGHRSILEKGAKDGYAVEIRRWVWWDLFDAMRVRLERQRRVKFTSTDDTGDVYAVPTGGTWNREDFVCGLSEDGRYAVALALNPPAAIEKVAQEKGGTPRNYKSTVRQYLKDTGWSTDRINAAFEEIVTA